MVDAYRGVVTLNLGLARDRKVALIQVDLGGHDNRSNGRFLGSVALFAKPAKRHGVESAPADSSGGLLRAGLRLVSVAVAVMGVLGVMPIVMGMPMGVVGGMLTGVSVTMPTVVAALMINMGMLARESRRVMPWRRWPGRAGY